MTTSSLHTRHRPKDWKGVVGQDSIVASLQTSLEKDMSHTYLLVGPSGLGKTTLARIAAIKLNCPRPLEIDAATFTGIDDMRQVTSTLHFKPLEGEVKVIIIDEVHMLSKAAFQSLLKSLEEPPQWVYFFLCTTEAGKVPANIKTRCTTYILKPVSLDVLQDLLTSVIKKEKLEVKDSIVELCAKEANGSPRQAIVNLEVCYNIKDKAKALDLLQSASEAPEAIDLARALLKGESWKKVQSILSGMRDKNAESVRHVVRAYSTNVILAAKSDDVAGQALEILDAFSTPFPSGDGLSPLVLACGRILLSE